MNRYLSYRPGVLFLFLSSLCQAAQSVPDGITFPATRVVYPESESTGITFTVTNNTDNLYLLQSRVIPAAVGDTDGEKVPFIVIPPLTRFEPGSSVTLLIRQSAKVQQTDRESLWLLAVKAIPAQSEQNNSGETTATSVVLALQNNLKLFYRPESLQDMTPEERAAQLEFNLHDGMLTVTNPAPYYVTFRELLVDGTPVNTGNDKTLAPHTTIRYPVGHWVSRNISWSLADDHGSATELREESLP